MGIYMNYPRDGSAPQVVILASNPHIEQIRATCAAQGTDLVPLSQSAFDELMASVKPL